MTELSGIPLPVLLLLPFSLAAGVDLFLTLLVVSASLDLGWGGMPLGFEGALRWGALTVVALLYLMEGGMELRPLRGLVWHNLQLLLRPLGGILLALTLLEGLPTSLLLGGACLAGIVSAFAHAMSWGEKLRQFLAPRRRVSAFTDAVAEDTLVLVLLVLAIEQPAAGFLVSGALLLVGLLMGSSLHMLTRFGVSLLRERIWGMASPTRWQDASELPEWVGKWGRAEGFSGIQGLRCGAQGLGASKGFKEGWLLETGGLRFFAYRRLMGATFLPMEGLQMFPGEPSDIAIRVPLEAREGSRSALFLHRGGPEPKSHK